MTATLHIENKVRDYESWKQVFDKFDRFRRDGGVRHHRIHRDLEDPCLITIDLDFDTTEQAAAFRDRLRKVWASPQSREQLTAHTVAAVQEVLEQRAGGRC